jgi:hypothetical protein
MWAARLVSRREPRYASADFALAFTVLLFHGASFTGAAYLLWSLVS